MARTQPRRFMPLFLEKSRWRRLRLRVASGTQCESVPALLPGPPHHALGGDLDARGIPDRDRDLEGPRRAIAVRADDRVLALALAADLPRCGPGLVAPIDDGTELLRLGVRVTEASD